MSTTAMPRSEFEWGPGLASTPRWLGVLQRRVRSRRAPRTPTRASCFGGLHAKDHMVVKGLAVPASCAPLAPPHRASVLPIAVPSEWRSSAHVSAILGHR
jgi:hypothetical protein